MNEFKEKANGAFKSVAKTAKIVTLTSKKRVEISLIKKEINRCYAKLGKIFYKDYITDEEPDDAEYAPLCEKISESFRRINALKEEIKDLNDDFFDRKSQNSEQTDAQEVDFVDVEDVDFVSVDDVVEESDEASASQ